MLHPAAAYASTEYLAFVKAKSYAPRIFAARSHWKGSFSHQLQLAMRFRFSSSSTRGATLTP